MPDTQETANAEQTRAWNGPDGDNWTANENWYNAAARYLTPSLFAAAAIAPTEHVVDIGCGTGETTRLAAREARAGSAFGIDLSEQMIERARQRAAEEGLRNVRFEQGDAQIYPFERERFDLAISRYGSMFFDDPVKAFANVAAGIRPGGRVALLCWRELARNEWVREMRAALAAGRSLPEPPPHAPSAFAFADPDRVRGILSAAGFEEISLDPVDEPMYFGPDAARAFEGASKLGTVKGLLTDLDKESRRRALDGLEDLLRAHETPEGVLLGSSAWLVRASKARGKERT
jgi:SAM-dependent methyltransferase